MTTNQSEEIAKSNPFREENIQACLDSFEKYLRAEVEKMEKDGYKDFQVEVKLVGRLFNDQEIHDKQVSG